MSLISTRALPFAAAVLLLSPALLAQNARNLLSNGGFENPPVPEGASIQLAEADGWSATGGSVEIQDRIGALVAPLGEQHLQLSSGTIVTQTATTLPAARYALAFAFSPGVDSFDHVFQVWYGGSMLEEITAPGGAVSWSYRSYPVDAVGGADTVEFHDVSGQSTGILIDDVSLVPYDPASSVQLLRNASFENDPRIDPGTILETPVYEGWYSLQDSEVEIQNRSDVGDPYHGSYVCDLDEQWGVGQYVELVAGESYELTFWMSPNPSEDRTRETEVAFGGAVIDTITQPASTGAADWTQYSYTVSSDDPLTSLTFQDLSGGGNGALLDLVRLVGPQPEMETAGTVIAERVQAGNQSIGLFLSPRDSFGRAIGSLGDLDGDGVLDLAIGTIGDDDGGNKTGSVWILFMNANKTVKAAQKISELRGNLGVNLDANDGFGRALDGVGDLDGDGIPDLVVGSNRDDDGASNAGAAYVLFLNSDGTVRDRHKISATSGDNLAYVPTSGREFGASVAGMGDIDGDGINDVAIGARHADSVQICFMNTDGTVRESTNLTFGQNGFDAVREPSGGWGELFGMSCANMGDFDGDGINDITVGSYCREIYGQRCVGAQFLLLLNSDGTCKEWFYYGPENINPLNQYIGHFDEFGVACSGAGDLDGDGVRDILVGAHREGSTWGHGLNQGSMTGAVYALLLNQNGTLKSAIRIGNDSGGLQMSIGNSTRLGEGVYALGDMDGNGKVDIAVGSRFMFNTGAIFFLELESAVPQGVVANFSGDPLSGPAPLDVDFTDLSGGAVVDWFWDFGDGATSTESSPSHTYSADGSYTVSLSVADDGGGNDSKTKTDYVVVGEDVLPDGVEAHGCGVNAPGSLAILSGQPSLGSTMVFGVHNPFGTQAPGSRTVVFLSWNPDPAFPCGTIQPNRGMEAPGTDGELLIRFPAVKTLFGPPWPGGSDLAQVSWKLPGNTGLIGRKIYVQGRILDDTSGALIPLAHTEAYELTFLP